jgi:uncharacterized repeat protein (TIGR03803 family)
VLLEFPGTSDGFVITGLVTDSAGNLYGVNSGFEGGENGAVAELTPPGSSGDSWTESVVYRFKGVALQHQYGDGSFPLGVSFDHRGHLFGTTFNGGYCTLSEGGFCSGTVFELTPPVPAGHMPWIETMLYRFSQPDQPPSANVIVAPDGSIYGVSLVCVYALVNSNLIILHSYSDNAHGNGMAPEATPLLGEHGDVYGTTCAGGTHNNGIVFKLEVPVGTTKWKQVVLHEFDGGSDGLCPEAPLIFSPNGALFGTTDNGGKQCAESSFGCGTVFKIVP